MEPTIVQRVVQWPEKVTLLRAWKWAKLEKLRRFQEKNAPTLDEFVRRQLVDTQYSSRLARQYLQVLFDNPRQVEVTKGALTAVLRRHIRLENTPGAGTGGAKSRADHRHHVIDALMVCLSTPSQIQRLARSVEEGAKVGERFWKRIESELAPLQGVLAEAVQDAVISFGHRNRVRGSLHGDSSYGRRGKALVLRRAIGVGSDGKFSLEEVRKQAEDCLDPALRKAMESPVSASLAEGEFGIVGPNGKPVKRVRLEASVKNPLKILRRGRDVPVANDGNHHVEIWATAKGKWRMGVMSMQEAYERKTKKLPIHGALGKEGETFVMNLRKRDVVELTKGPKAGVWCVSSLSTGGQVVLKNVFDARGKETLKKLRLLYSPAADGLQKGGARRRLVDELGYPLAPHLSKDAPRPPARRERLVKGMA